MGERWHWFFSGVAGLTFVVLAAATACSGAKEAQSPAESLLGKDSVSEPTPEAASSGPAAAEMPQALSPTPSSQEELRKVYIHAVGGLYVRSVQELTDVADVVILGQVISTRRFLDDTGLPLPDGTTRKLPYTVSTLKVESLLKGNVGDTVEITQRGGVVDSPGGPQLVMLEFDPLVTAGERYLLFLDYEDSRLGKYWVIGPRGIFVIENGRLQSPVPAELRDQLMAQADPVLTTLQDSTEADALAMLR
ncbi:MAG: hypothetical protein ACE5IZ_08455 [Dehalococcoidia bacterium]